VSSAGYTPPSPADKMRLQLAKARLAETRGMNLAEAPPATLIMAVRRLQNVVEDLTDLLDTCWSEPN
jgi:hypothetical protein